MPIKLIEKPTVVEAAGNVPKKIEEFIGCLNEGDHARRPEDRFPLPDPDAPCLLGSVLRERVPPPSRGSTRGLTRERLGGSRLSAVSARDYVRGFAICILLL